MLARLFSVCDIDFEKTYNFSNRYNVTAYKDIDSMLQSEKDIDVVSISSPKGLHAEHSIKALNAGFHVLCEKPLGINIHECGEMINAADRNTRRLFAIKQNRFNPPVSALKKILMKVG